METLHNPAPKHKTITFDLTSAGPVRRKITTFFTVCCTKLSQTKLLYNFVNALIRFYSHLNKWRTVLNTFLSLCLNTTSKNLYECFKHVINILYTHTGWETSHLHHTRETKSSKSTVMNNTTNLSHQLLSSSDRCGSKEVTT